MSKKEEVKVKEVDTPIKKEGEFKIKSAKKMKDLGEGQGGCGSNTDQYPCMSSRKTVSQKHCGTGKHTKMNEP